MIFVDSLNRMEQIERVKKREIVAGKKEEI